MARTRKVFGPCHICGAVTQLTFEHVPPRAAFNDRPIVGKRFEELFKGDLIENIDNFKGEKSQKGAGVYSLCERCNNVTGAWYGNAFIDWSYQGLILGEQAEIAPSLHLIFRIFPLRVIKQICCMFFSVNSPGLNEAQPDLVRFVLNKDHKYLDPKIRIYVFYNRAGRGRQSAISGILDFGSSGSARIFSEIAFPPFGYVLSIDSTPPDPRLIDISFFANYRNNDWKDITLNIPVLPVYTPFPGDYRSRETVIAQSERSISEQGML